MDECIDTCPRNIQNIDSQCLNLCNKVMDEYQYQLVEKYIDSPKRLEEKVTDSRLFRIVK